MSEILLPRRFKSQPQYAAPIDYQGLGKGAQFLFNPAVSSIDLVTGRFWAPGGGAAIAIGGNGKSFSYASAGDYHGFTGYPELTSNVGTFFMWCPVVGAADSNGHVFFGASSPNVSGHQVNAAGFIYIGSNSGSSGTLTSWFNTTNRSIVLASDGTAAGCKAFVDGVDTGFSWSSAPVAWGAGNKNFNLGRYVGAGGFQFYGSMLCAGNTSVVWGAREAKAFHESRGLTLFKAPARRIFSVSSSPDRTAALSGQILAAAQGSLAPSTSVALTGQSLTSSQGSLSPSTSLPLTGQSLTSSQGTLTPNTSVALSGQALTSSQGTLATNGDVTVTLSGQSVTSSQGTLTPSATGQSITIQLTGQSLIAGQGSLSLDQYIWDTTQGRAQPGRGTFRPLKPNEMSKPEIVVVDIPEEESTYEHHPVSDAKPARVGPRAGISGIKLPKPPITTLAPVQNRDYKALMARAGTKTKTMKLSDFPVKQNKKYLTKTRGPVTLKGN